jgi:putrescine aminotransferase
MAGDDGGAYDRREILKAYKAHVNKGLARLGSMMGSPLEVRAEGPVVYDEHDTAMLDCGGYGVFILGHCHPRVVEAARRQLERHPVSTRVLLSPELALAAQAVAGVTPPGLDYVFFASAGAEAVEAAIKIARLSGRPNVIATHNGFHGKTMGALSVTGREVFQAPFAPLLPNVAFVDYGAAAALEHALAALPPDSALVIFEPVQAEGGVVLPPDGYLAEARQACDRYGALLALDEIQTGMGRLGTWWGADRESVSPDLLLAGKALGGGLMPVSAVVATAQAFEGLNRDPFLHTSTFAGTPLAAATARATVETMQAEGIVERAAALADELHPLVRQAVKPMVDAGLVVDVRARGLLIGMEMRSADLAGELVFELLERKVVVSHSLNANKVVRLTPPAVLEPTHVDWLIDALGHGAEKIAAQFDPDRSAHSEQQEA